MKKKDTYIDTAIEILCIGKSTYYQWKREERPIIFLLEKYCTEEDLLKFNSNKSIPKLDLALSSLDNYLKNNRDNYLNLFKIGFVDSFYFSHDIFHHFYFSFLKFLHLNKDQWQTYSISSALVLFSNEYFNKYKIKSIEKEEKMSRYLKVFDNINLSTFEYLIYLVETDFDEFYINLEFDKEDKKHEDTLSLLLTAIGFIIFKQRDLVESDITKVTIVVNEYINKKSMTKEEILNTFDSIP